MPNLRTIFAFINRHRRLLSSVSTVLGFLFHIFLFNSIDLGLVVSILAAHLTIVSGAILLGAMPASGGADTLFMRMRSLAPLLYQYSTGALLSGFLILYASSGSLIASLPFLAIVTVAAIGNEVARLEKYLLPFQTTLFALSLILYGALAAPLIVGSIGRVPFLIGAGAAIGVYMLFSIAGLIVARKEFFTSIAARASGATAVFGVVIICYFINLIPPIPLAAKEIDFYHRVTHHGSTWTASDETRKVFERFFDLPGVTLHLTKGESAYVYTAVFAPAKLGTTIVHRWEHYDQSRRTWVTAQTVRFQITGGREGGYRGYSLDTDPEDGAWRVSVETESGAVIGRAYMTVVYTPTPRSLIGVNLP